MISEENALVVKDQYSGEWSRAVNTQFDSAREYAGVIRRLAAQLLPELSHEEWQYVLNAFNGTFHEDRFRSPQKIASAVMDDYGVEILDNCEPEFQAAIRKLAALSQPEQFAVREFAAWYWSAQHGDSFDDAILAFKKPFVAHLLKKIA